jgi:hypothetical protein
VVVPSDTSKLKSKSPLKSASGVAVTEPSSFAVTVAFSPTDKLLADKSSPSTSDALPNNCSWLIVIAPSSSTD